MTDANPTPDANPPPETNPTPGAQPTPGAHLPPDAQRLARLVSLACHDLRTPLATVYGFARTIGRAQGLDPTVASYVEMIESASQQLGELIDELSLAARIAGDRYEPKLERIDTLELAAAAAARLGEERVGVSGEGAEVAVDVEPAKRSIASLVRCALRHGGLDRVEIAAERAQLRVSPITPASAPVVLGEDLRDLGAAVAVLHVERLGGSVAVEGEVLTVRLPG